MNSRNIASLCILCAIFSTFQRASAQGNLTPPGAPAPTMKTLDQVEARTPISSAPYTITQPGSYYLTTNLTVASGQSGIAIFANGVTLDLNGFELAGVAGTTWGIYVSPSYANIAIRNGTVRGWSQAGVNAPSASNCQFERLRVLNNGNYGIYVGDGNTVKDCTANGNNPYGIVTGSGSTISGCMVTGNSIGISTGTGCNVSGCTASGQSSYGIYVLSGSLVKDCVANTNGSHGIVVPAGNGGVTVNGCTARGNAGTGIGTSDGSTVMGCTAVNNTANGISVGADSTVNGCTTRANSASGVSALTGCTVSGCTAGFNGSQGISVGDRSTVIGCSANSNTNNGIAATNGCLIKECQTGHNSGDGINIGSGFRGATIRSCTSSANKGDGIKVSDYSFVADNTCDCGPGAATGAGIHATGFANRIENNHTSGHITGIYVVGGDNLIVRNWSINITNYTISANNNVGVTVEPTQSGFSGSNGGAGVGTDPWGNFSD